MTDFKYKTGKEIIENREELKQLADKKDMEDRRNKAITQLNEIWAIFNIQDQLIRNGFAHIVVNGLALSNPCYPRYSTEFCIEDKRLDLLEKSIRKATKSKKIQKSCYSLFDLVGVDTSCISSNECKNIRAILISKFDIKDVWSFSQLMDEYGFDWDVCINVKDTFFVNTRYDSRFSLLLYSILYPFTHKTYIYDYEWILAIEPKKER